ncbi:MAG: YceI family protein [Roseiflexaceae bacterium]
MKKLVVLSVLVVLLTACGATAPAAEPTVAPTMAVVAEPTMAPAAAEPTTDAAAEATVAPVAATTGNRTFVIDPAQSSAQYAVEEIFFSDNRLFTAVGVTNAVEGEFEVTADGKPSGKVTRMRVDLRTLKSDSPRRDNAIRRQWLESDTYPYADFVSTDALNLPERYTEGEQVTFTLVGDMTVRDVTKSVEWTVVGTLQGDTVTGEAKTVIKMSDFGFAAPDIGGVLKAEDEVALTVTFVAIARP